MLVGFGPIQEAVLRDLDLDLDLDLDPDLDLFGRILVVGIHIPSGGTFKSHRVCVFVGPLP
jgi:hypothetical protein